MPPIATSPFRPSIPTAARGALLVLLGAASCATGQQLEMKKVDAVAQPPANVAFFLKIARPDGQPVTLLAKDFKVYEDGKPSKKVKRALLPVKYAVDRYLLVLVDLSGPLVDSEYLSTLQDAVASLAERVEKDVRLGVSGFDGEGIVPFVPFLPSSDTELKAGLATMRKFRPRSRNIDLWGTFITSLDLMDQVTRQSTVPHQQATLVLVTDRRDKAGRHSQQDALARVQKSGADVFVVGIGDGINREDLEPLGKTGALFADEPRDLQKPFVELADRLEARMGQDYLFSYCSPQKAGGKRSANHIVELRIATPQWHATVEHEFSTRGFTKQSCDPEAKPDFKTASKDSNGDRRAEAKAESKIQNKTEDSRTNDQGPRKTEKPDPKSNPAKSDGDGDAEEVEDTKG